MSITHGQSTGGAFGNSTSGRAVTFSGSTTSGSTIVVSIAAYAGTGTTSPNFTVTDNKSNTYAQCDAKLQSGADTHGCVQQFYCENVAGGASHQITVTPSLSAFICFGITELRGTKTSGALGDTDTQSETGTAPNTDNIVIAEANMAIVGVVTHTGGDATLTAGGAYSQAFESEDADASMPIHVEYDLDVDTDQAADWAVGASRDCIMSAAAFKEEPAGGGGGGKILIPRGMTGGMAELVGGCRG